MGVDLPRSALGLASVGPDATDAHAPSSPSAATETPASEMVLSELVRKRREAKKSPARTARRAADDGTSEAIGANKDEQDATRRWRTRCREVGRSTRSSEARAAAMRARGGGV